MTSKQAQTLLNDVCHASAKLGEIKKAAKEIKINHDLALDLWASKVYFARLLAVLIMDKKLIDQTFIDQLVNDIEALESSQQTQISEWLLANQLMKSKKTTALLLEWQTHSSNVLRRLFWYHQARLRWTGKTPPNNTAELMNYLENNLIDEAPLVQWTMNFCAAQIGIHDEDFRERCIALGEKSELYKNDKVSKNCTPSYLPEFIRIEVDKLKR